MQTSLVCKFLSKLFQYLKKRKNDNKKILSNFFNKIKFSSIFLDIEKNIKSINKMCKCIG